MSKWTKKRSKRTRRSEAGGVTTHNGLKVKPQNLHTTLRGADLMFAAVVLNLV